MSLILHFLDPRRHLAAPAQLKSATLLSMVALCWLLLAGSGLRVPYATAPMSSLRSHLALRARTLTLVTMPIEAAGNLLGNNIQGPGKQSALSQYVPAAILAQAPTPAPISPTSARTGTTTDDNVNMRAGPGTNYKILAQLPANTRAQILGEQTGWYRILTSWGTEGWVSAYFFKVTQASVATAQPPSIGSAGTVGVVNMRTGPGTSYPIAGRLSDSTVLEVLAL